MEQLRNGKPVIVDFHTHIFPEWLRAERGVYAMRDQTFGALYGDGNAFMPTAEDLIAVMDEDGVDAAVVIGLGWTDYELAKSVNDYALESMRAWPGRLYAFAGVNPSWGDRAVDETIRCAEAGMRGIGELHPDTQGYDLGDRTTMQDLMRTATELGLIVNTHASEPVGHLYQGKGKTTPDVLMRFIGNFPDATIVCAHWGGGLPFYALMPEVAEACANVYFDSAASPYLYDRRVFNIAANLVGHEKLLMGSDYGLVRPRRLLRQIDRAGLSQEAADAIKGNNAARLMGIAG
jgi:hypothetical protein